MSQQYQVGRGATTISTEDGFTKVVYHSTPVVKFNHEKIILNSGGWHTATTKTRMNQASNQFGLGFRVSQQDYSWFVEYNGKRFDFYDGIELTR